MWIQFDYYMKNALRVVLKVVFYILLWSILFIHLVSVSKAETLFSYLYTHYSEQESLGSLLTDFAFTQGYSAIISPAVRGNVSGFFKDENPYQFLEGMRSAFGVMWYMLGKTMYFYTQAELQRVFISPQVMTVERLYHILLNSSVISPQLPIQLNGDMIILSGPPHYIEQVLQAVSIFEVSQLSNITMRVFPLKYASADDIVIQSMDKTVTVPGIASILRAMLNGQQETATTIVEQPATVNKLNGEGLASKGKEKTEKGNEVKQQAAGVNIMADPRMNAVVINDAAYRMPYYEEVIHDLDKPLELVEIHAAIVDIDSEFKRDLGFTLQQGSSKKSMTMGGDFSTTQQSLPVEITKGTVEGGGLTYSTIYSKGVEFFLARVQALETEGEARVLGKPSVLTVDNIQATLENTSTYYIQVQGYQTVDLFKVESGTVLRVTPHIIYNNDGTKSIKLVVAIEDNQNDNSTDPTVGSNVVLPPIKQTRINTQGVVNTGQSLLIGGYYYEQQGVNDKGIPILKDIPIIGYLFKTNTKTSKKMERLILITPRIIMPNTVTPIPTQVDDPSFHRSAVQDTYEDIKPKSSTGGGCSRNRSTPVIEEQRLG